MRGVHRRAISSCSSSALYLVDCIDNLNYAQLGFLKRLGDRNALVDVHRDGLLGHPAVLVLEDFKRRLGVAL